MAHEIYYTSAPEGLRPGDRGFCTVAATEGIPKNLWDRLEALSGYRHNANGQNPVALAHWVLAIGGQNYHVLSRVCDAGLDYTQRTNSFAHHIVLEPSELAPAGPTAMLTQPGMFVERWDGQVGAIRRRTLPSPNDVHPRVCLTWQSSTGDAGWAGSVAQMIATAPWKPVGLIFAPDQDVMPLIAEVTALLPHAARWQATFNTYFTSLPGGMTCQWRCCLAGSPTAATLRSSTGGLVVDLTRPDALGAPPDSPWVHAARSGSAVQSVGKSAPIVPAAKLTVPVGKPSALPPALSVRADVPEPAVRREKAFVIHRRGLIGTTPEVENQPSVPVPEFSWMAERRRTRRRQLMMLYGVACLTLVAGLWIALWSYHTSADRPLPPSSQPMVVAPLPAVETPAPPPPPVVVQTLTPVIEKPPASAPVVVVPPTVATVLPPPPPPAFAVDPLPPIGTGNVMRGPISSVAVPVAKLDHPQSIAQLSLAFPDGAIQWQCKLGELDGVFTQAPGSQPHPHVQINWQDTSAMARPTLVATVRLDLQKHQIDVTWNNTTLLRQAELTKLTYWVLQNSTVIASDASGQRTQRITFSPLAIKPMRLTDPDFAGSLPQDLPLPPDLHIGKSDPDGWLPGIPDASEKPDGDAILLRVEKPPGQAGIIPGFTLRYSPAHRTLSSNLAKTIEAARAEIDSDASDSNKAKEQIQKLRDGFAPGTAAIESAIKDWTEKKDKSAASPQPGDLTQEQFQRAIDKLNTDLKTQATQLDAALAPFIASQKAADDRAAAMNAALAAYSDLKELEINLELPPGLHVGTVHLKREAN